MAILSDPTLEILKPLVLYSAGIILYSIFVYNFYRSLSRKDIFSINLHQYNTATHPVFKKAIKLTLYFLEYIILFPLFTFLWFAFLAIFILVLSQEQNVSNVLLLTMAIIISTRVTAYYKEDLSKDLAKILPFALLGVFIINPNFFSISELILRIKEIPLLTRNILSYALFTIVLEFVIRVPYTAYNLGKKEEVGEPEEEDLEEEILEDETDEGLDENSEETR